MDGSGAAAAGAFDATDRFDRAVELRANVLKSKDNSNEENGGYWEDQRSRKDTTPLIEKLHWEGEES